MPLAIPTGVSAESIFFMNSKWQADHTFQLAFKKRPGLKFVLEQYEKKIIFPFGLCNKHKKQQKIQQKKLNCLICHGQRKQYRKILFSAKNPRCWLATVIKPFNLINFTWYL